MLIKASKTFGLLSFRKPAFKLRHNFFDAGVSMLLSPVIAYRVESALADTPSHTAVLNQC